MIIEKKQKDVKRHIFNWSYFSLAREGLKCILQTKELTGKKILVPGYLGYSAREGSGVFDPIRETKMQYIFYNLDGHLNINVKDLKSRIKKNQGNALLIIHYFGFRDRNLEVIKQYAKKYNMIIIEDFAHAFFSFWLNPIIDFDYGIFSIHKLFPVDSGGMVIGRKKIKYSKNNGNAKYNLFNYDIKEIIQKRIENYRYISSRLKEKAASYKIVSLKEELHEVVPQTFPILLHDSRIRDHLYFQMNEEGYGVISLYHTLIEEIDNSFSVEHEIASRILNLPVHQDTGKKELGYMIDRMFKIVKGYGLKNKK